MNFAPRHASRAQREQTIGTNVARLLRGAWRAQVPSPKSQVQAEPRPLGRAPGFWTEAKPSLTVGVPLGTQAEDSLSEAELTEILPVLCGSGSGALAWYRISNTPLADTAAGEELHEVYRRFRLSAVLHELEIAHVFSLLRAAGIEAVLVKGWAIARRYPDRALRPYGDIDICVSPDQFAPAAAALKCLESLDGHYVDLHDGFTHIGMQARNARQTFRGFRNLLRSPSGLSEEWDELFARSSVVACAGERVRILSDEDHLRLLSIHLMRSGAWRPVWLCDIAVLLESLVQSPKSNVQSPSGTPTVREGSVVSSPASSIQRRDTLPNGRGSAWDRHWTLDIGHWTALHANWIRTSVALAHELLGARLVQSPTDRVAVTDSSRGLSALRDTPGSSDINVSDPEGVKARIDPTSNVQSLEPLPRWLVRAVLKQWGRSRVQSPTTKGSPKSKVQSPSRTPTVREGSVFPTASVQCRGTLPNSRGSAWLRLWTLDLGHWTGLYRRWDNPIRATAAVGGEFNNWPRLPYRVMESMMRLPELWKIVGSGQWAVSRGQRSEGRQRSEVRDQRTEVRDQRSEVRKQRPAGQQVF